MLHPDIKPEQTSFRSDALTTTLPAPLVTKFQMYEQLRWVRILHTGRMNSCRKFHKMQILFPMQRPLILNQYCWLLQFYTRRQKFRSKFPHSATMKSKTCQCVARQLSLLSLFRSLPDKNSSQNTTREKRCNPHKSRKDVCFSYGSSPRLICFVYLFAFPVSRHGNTTLRKHAAS